MKNLSRSDRLLLFMPDLRNWLAKSGEFQKA